MDRRDIITVEIDRQVLWIGAGAYPLRNIARAKVEEFVPDHWETFWRFLSSLVVVVVPAAAALAVIKNLELSDSDRENAQRIVVALLVALVLIFVVRLVSGLSTPTYYALVIETAGAPHAVLVSVSVREVSRLVGQIMDAISNPHAAYKTTVVNHFNQHIGDRISQIGGNGNIGKRVGN
ncbi:DUF6232 family protein [Streptomyces sp. NPDC059788]|uniref:DUF6232 family protein n=1 Tax=Streptomyces sp. NPDC059788 TaxID=3346948 RepID=UPI00365585F1